MQEFFNMKFGWALALFIIIDIICLGMGMGVPFFNILFGLPVGWYIAHRMTIRKLCFKLMLREILLCAVMTAGLTMLLLIPLWTPTALMLFDSSADLANWGIPMILFEPRASFIGWLILMIIISPFLQLLMTIFGAFLTVMWDLPKDKDLNISSVS